MTNLSHTSLHHSQPQSEQKFPIGSSTSSDSNMEYTIRCKNIEIDQVENELEELHLQIDHLQNDLRIKIDRQDISEGDIENYQSQIDIYETEIFQKETEKTILIEQLYIIKSKRSEMTNSE